MAKAMPSMIALLGMLAVAGYQNRDKLGDMLNGMGGQSADPANPNRQTSGSGDLLGNLGGALGGMLGGNPGGGLGDIVDRFKQSGRGDKVDSWINTGANASVDASDLEETLGEDTLTELGQKTGLSRSELLERLSKTLPDAVNHLTPDGRLPQSSGGFV